jgi:antitoxin ParD1/3/4
MDILAGVSIKGVSPMNVSLTKELERLVQKKVNGGLYLSASEVVREALRLLDERDNIRRVQMQKLRKQVSVGLSQLDRGLVIPGEEVIEEIRQKSQRKKRSV